MVSTSFDPGNGDDPVVCAGHGTPIPESEKSSMTSLGQIRSQAPQPTQVTASMASSSGRPSWASSRSERAWWRCSGCTSRPPSGSAPRPQRQAKPNYAARRMLVSTIVITAIAAGPAAGRETLGELGNFAYGEEVLVEKGLARQSRLFFFLPPKGRFNGLGGT